jgi:hypothetical protein
MTQSTIATMADYADAMISARRAKNWLFVLLLIMLLAQLVGFLAMRYTEILPKVQQGDASGWCIFLYNGLRALTAVIDFLGIVLAIVMVLVLFLLVTIMLVGRAIGVARLTAAFVWMVLLAALLFPWQALLSANSSLDNLVVTAAPVPAPAPPATLPATTGAAAVSVPTPPTIPITTVVQVHAAHRDDTAALFHVPGVLWTFEELRADAKADWGGTSRTILKWSRYVGFPVLAILLLLVVQVQSSRGLKLALGETEMPGHEAPPAA